jgi:hypothetical protein
MSNPGTSMKRSRSACSSTVLKQFKRSCWLLAAGF